MNAHMSAMEHIWFFPECPCGHRWRVWAPASMTESPCPACKKMCTAPLNLVRDVRRRAEVREFRRNGGWDGDLTKIAPPK